MNLPQQNTQPTMICLTCKKAFEVWPYELATRKYCSVVCKGMGWDTNEANNPRWRGGKTLDSHGYILVKAPKDHPYKTKAGYIREHRLVMEKSIGRYLFPTEDVHHLNGDKTDNRIENLGLFSNRTQHLRHEHKEGLYRKHLAILNGVN